MEEWAKCHEQAASKSWESNGWILPLEPPEGTLTHDGFLNPQNCKMQQQQSYYGPMKPKVLSGPLQEKSLPTTPDVKIV